MRVAFIDFRVEASTTHIIKSFFDYIEFSIHHYLETLQVMAFLTSLNIISWSLPLLAEDTALCKVSCMLAPPSERSKIIKMKMDI